LKPGHKIRQEITAFAGFFVHAGEANVKVLSQDELLLQ
jgi:hypothetical protein